MADKRPMTLLSLSEEDRNMLKALAEAAGTTYTGLVRYLIIAEYGKVFGSDKETPLAN